MLREVPTLEQMCLATVTSNLVRLRDGCMNGLPDYIRFQLFQSVQKRNPLLLHGQTLRAILSGAHFKDLDMSNACNLSDNDLAAIAPSLVKVRTLKLVSCHYISEHAIAAALRCCTSLTKLQLESCAKITGALCLCPDVLPPSLGVGQKDGVGGRIGDHGPAGPNAATACEWQGGGGMYTLSLLTELSLRENGAFCDEGLRHIAQHATSLENLCLSKCEK